MTKKQILQILNDRSTYILDFKDETHNAIELEDFNYVADAILSLYSSSTLLKEKEIPDFEDWIHLTFKQIGRNVYNLFGTSKIYSKAQVLKIYRKEILNL